MTKFQQFARFAIGGAAGCLVSFAYDWVSRPVSWPTASDDLPLLVLAAVVTICLVGTVFGALAALVFRQRKPRLWSLILLGMLVVALPPLWQAVAAWRECHDSFQSCYIMSNLPLDWKNNSFPVAVFDGWLKKMIEGSFIGACAHIAWWLGQPLVDGADTASISEER